MLRWANVFLWFCGKTAAYGQAFHRVAMLWLIKLQSYYHHFTLPLWGLAETSQAAVKLDISDSGRGTAPLQPQAPVTCLARGCLHPPCRSRTFPFLCHHLPTPRRQPSLLPLRLWTQPPAQRNPSPATPHNLLLYFYLLYKPVYHCSYLLVGSLRLGARLNRTRSVGLNCFTPTTILSILKDLV